MLAVFWFCILLGSAFAGPVKNTCFGHIFSWSGSSVTTCGMDSQKYPTDDMLMGQCTELDKGRGSVLVDVNCTTATLYNTTGCTGTPTIKLTTGKCALHKGTNGTTAYLAVLKGLFTLCTAVITDTSTTGNACPPKNATSATVTYTLPGQCIPTPLGAISFPLTNPIGPKTCDHVQLWRSNVSCAGSPQQTLALNNCSLGRWLTVTGWNHYSDGGGGVSHGSTVPCLHGLNCDGSNPSTTGSSTGSTTGGTTDGGNGASFVAPSLLLAVLVCFLHYL
eukprot:TRINITY_DN67255_c5_g1_i1.p1 TRINITY_DN67255_c5_g1~~TRINITY_DN67255_c5_g1_i1.p1  ORF type:complete len:277 (-),score=4.79 TRINITY_DN67255_c5_g1_i1:181-1011(-)